MKLATETPEKGRGGVVEILNVLPSNEYVLYTKTRNYHWNVVGMQANELHKFFEAQYEVNDIVDEVAERVRAVGGPSFGSLAEFLKHSKLREAPGESVDASTMLASLLHDHETILRSLRKDQEVVLDQHGDVGTNNFLIGLIERHEKMAWMLQAFLEGKTD